MDLAEVNMESKAYQATVVTIGNHRRLDRHEVHHTARARAVERILPVTVGQEVDIAMEEEHQPAQVTTRDLNNSRRYSAAL